MESTEDVTILSRYYVSIPTDIAHKKHPSIPGFGVAKQINPTIAAKIYDYVSHGLYKSYLAFILFLS